MPRKPSRILIASPAIISFFDESNKHVFTEGELGGILSENRATWKLPDYINTSRFIGFLSDTGKFSVAKVASEHYRSATRYIWGKASPFAVGLSLRSSAYLSHGTAVFLHGLTDQIPRTLYVNKEQSVKPRSTSPLTPEALARAFSGQQRQLYPAVETIECVVLHTTFVHRRRRVALPVLFSCSAKSFVITTKIAINKNITVRSPGDVPVDLPIRAGQLRSLDIGSDASGNHSLAGASVSEVGRNDLWEKVLLGIAARCE